MLISLCLHHFQISPSHVERKEIHLEQLVRRNNEMVQCRARTNLSRSKSMGSLQNSPGSIVALKAQYESKDATQNNVKSTYTAAHVTPPYKAADMSVKHGDAEEVKPEEQPKSADAQSKTKERHVTQKVNEKKYEAIIGS